MILGIHDDEDFSEIQKHHCGQAEYGATDIIGYNLIDEAPETPPAGESQPAGKKAASTVSIVMYQDAGRDTLFR